ncbi:hypothetical protein NE547_15770, partial [Flavonifractor sp. DFI.6.63]|uniref:hypothetical protein n=1 Tax=Flavonifractor sp. DFI.6.63 TaxID=2963704 RepID=UPI002109CE00
AAGAGYAPAAPLSLRKLPKGLFRQTVSGRILSSVYPPLQVCKTPARDSFSNIFALISTPPTVTLLAGGVSI